MSVGVVSFEPSGSDLSGGHRRASLGTGTPEFAALLSIAQALSEEASDLVSGQQVIDHDAACKVEASRAVTVTGHLRTTVIHFTDGSSSVETSVLGDDPAPAPLAAFHPVAPLWGHRITAFSDLEPETGLDHRRDAEAALAHWPIAKAARAAGPERRPAARDISYERPQISEQARALEAMRVGKMVDILI